MAPDKKTKTSGLNTPVIVVIVVIVLCILSMIVAGIVAAGLAVLRYNKIEVPSPVVINNDADRTSPILTPDATSPTESPWSRLLEREYQEYVADGQVSSVSFEGSPKVGDAAAPVTIIEFTDFECPFCKRHWTEVEPVLNKQYVESNKLQRVVKHLIVVSQHNPAARQEALAAYCADRQGRFIPYFNELFKGSRGNGLGYQGKRGSVDSLVSAATGLTLNAEQFRDCLQAAAGASQIEKDTLLAQTLITSTKNNQQTLGTPVFWICRTNNCRSGTMVLGALPAPVFMKVIDYYLQTGSN